MSVQAILLSDWMRQLLDWIIESFRPEKFPWFREQFIHPKELAEAYKGGPLPNYLEGFFGVSDTAKR